MKKLAIAAIVAALVTAVPVTQAASSEQDPTATASCGPCVIVAGVAVSRAGMFALGAAVSAGGAVTVHEAIRRSTSEAREKSSKARNNPGAAKALIDRARRLRQLGSALWRVANGKIWRLIRIFKRYGNHLGPKLPGMARACLIVGAVIYAVSGKLENARDGCIGAAYGVARS